MCGRHFGSPQLYRIPVRRRDMFVMSLELICQETRFQNALMCACYFVVLSVVKYHLWDAETCVHVCNEFVTQLPRDAFSKLSNV